MNDRSRWSVLAACMALVVCTAPAWAADEAPPSLPSVGGAWVSQGPAHSTNGQVEGTTGGTPPMPTRPVTGAVQAIVAHPTDANTLWVGTVGGGIWKTTNATVASPTWTPLTDNFGSLAIGAMDRDPTDGTHNTLVAGIGRFTSFGVANGPRIGILRTTDGGTNWTLLGNSTLIGRNLSGVAPRGSTIVVSVNLADSFTCSNIGIWRSIDTGGTFVKISANNGATTGLPQGRAFDLTSDPTNNAILYTGIRDTPTCNSLATNTNGVYKSTDTGATWTRVSDATMNALLNPDSGVSNIRMAVGESGEVYAGIINNGQLAGLFRSGNGGTSWTQLDTPQTNENGTLFGTHPTVKPGSQGNLHFSIRADPTDANVVYVGGDRQPGNGDGTASFPNSLGAQDYSGRLFRVNAGLAPGSQATALTHNPSTLSNSAPHADSRRMVFNAAGDLLESDDGGIYRRTSPLATGDWFSVIGDLRVTEMHDVAYDRVSDMIISGNQDTGTTEQRTVGTTIWTSVHTGDGGDVFVDDIGSLTQSRRYTSFQFLGSFRHRIVNTAGATTSTTLPARTVIGGGPAFTAQFVTPVEVNTIDPTRILFAGSNDLYESFDRGTTITALGFGFSSPAMAYGGTSAATPNAAVLYALRSGSPIVYVRTAGSGAPVATATNPGTNSLRDIVLDPSDWQKVYVVNTANQVWSTVNAGGIWTNVTGNLTSGTSDLRTITFVPGAPSLLVVGGQPCLLPCAAGGPVYRMAVDAPGVWNQMGTGLPNNIAWDMDYDPVDDVLVVGTLGRGAWKLTSVSTPPTLSINDVTVTEGNTGTVNATFTVTLSATANASVSFAAADGTALAPSDYASGSGGVSFTSGGSTTQTITVVVNGDVVDEGNETFVVNLTSPSGATILDGQGQGTITDDDQTAVSVSNASLPEGLSGTGTATFTVSLSTPSAQTVIVPYSTANDTATSGSDYVATSSSLTFLPGELSQPLGVTVNGDVTVEPDETFFVNLGAPTNAVIADGQGVGTIVNDDPPTPSTFAYFVMLGQMRPVTVSNVDPSKWFKVRLVPGRSYAASAWAPSTDPSEAAVTLDLAWFLDDGATTPANSIAAALEPVPQATGHTGASASIIPSGIECVTATGCTYRLRVQAVSPTASIPLSVSIVETTMVSAYWQVAVGSGYEGAPQIRNNTSSPVSVTFTAYGNSGSLVCSNTFTVPADGMTTFGISGAAPGCSTSSGFGSAQIAHHGPPGSITANITTFSSVSGLSFDAPFRPRNTWTNLR